MYLKKTKSQTESAVKEIKDIIDDYVPHFKDCGIKVTCYEKTITITRVKAGSVMVVKFSCISNKEYTKEYAFWFTRKSVFRKKDCFLLNTKTLQNIKKVLEKTLQKANSKCSQTVCKPNIFDFIRYLGTKYFYKDSIGKLNLNIIRFILVAVVLFVFMILRLIYEFNYYDKYGHFPISSFYH